MIFGEEAMKGAIKLIGAAGNGKLATKHDTVSRSKGATAQIAKVKVDNLDGDLKNLFSAWEDVRIEVFDGQNSALRQLTTTATNWLATAGSWVRANPELVGTLVKVTAGVTALIGGLATLGLIAWPVMAGSICWWPVPGCWVRCLQWWVVRLRRRLPPLPGRCWH